MTVTASQLARLREDEETMDALRREVERLYRIERAMIALCGNTFVRALLYGKEGKLDPSEAVTTILQTVGQEPKSPLSCHSCGRHWSDATAVCCGSVVS
jgi:hypothetical protein